MVARARALGAKSDEMKKILQYNGGWRLNNESVQSLQIMHDEIQKIEWNNQTILLYDYKFAPNRNVKRCSDHHLHNGFDKSMEHMNEFGGEKIFEDRNQV